MAPTDAPFFGPSLPRIMEKNEVFVVMRDQDPTLSVGNNHLLFIAGAVEVIVSSGDRVVTIVAQDGRRRAMIRTCGWSSAG